MERRIQKVSPRSRSTYHVVHDPTGGWNVKRGGARKASRHFDRKVEAVQFGQKISKRHRTDLFIHRRDGTIERLAPLGRSPVKRVHLR